MISEKIKDFDRVAENIDRIICDKAIRDGVPIYELFKNIDGWSYDKTSYYIRKNPTSINDKFINMILENFNCSIEDILKGARRPRRENKTNETD